MDVNVLAERILLDLKNTFKKDPLIDEFDVLPVHESVSNKCPVIHIEHKIALEDWCVKHVYVYSYSNFFNWRKKPYKIDPDCLLSWTCAILLINPEIETVWHARKELVCQNLLLPENELKFSELVLRRKPKSSPVYAHRKWLLLQLRKGECSPCSLQHHIQNEFSLCTRAANLYSNNYYAWCHRSWTLTELCCNCLKIISEELSRTEQWVSTHISDHCGFHYRQFLLSSAKTTTLCPESCPCNLFPSNGRDSGPFQPMKELKKEFSLLGELQTIYLCHETLWYHRRYLLHAVHANTQSLVVERGDRCKRHKFDSFSEDELPWDCEKEEAFVRCRLEAAQTSGWERTLIERHVKWLKDVLSWQLALLPS